MTAIAAVVDPGPMIDGPLAGVRTTVKELIAVRGQALTANTAVELPQDVVSAEHEAPVVAMLRAAGARIESLSTTHELAWGITSWTEGRRVANPVVAGRVAGGSSGGAAALVRVGEADLGVGTDTAGSIRIPAGWCGIVGWKPTLDVIPPDGVLPLAPGFDTVGFLARDAAVLERVADVVGIDDDGPRPLRVAELRIPGATRDARLGPVVADALGMLGGLGHRIVGPVDGPDAGVVVSTFATLQLDASLRTHRDELGTWPAQADRYGEAIRRRLRAAEELDAAAVTTARDDRTNLLHAAGRWFDDLDALVLPTTGCRPPSQDRPDEIEIDGRWHDLRSIVLPHTAIANLLGAPAVSVPARIGDQPTGLQVLTPPRADRRALRLAVELTG